MARPSRTKVSPVPPGMARFLANVGDWMDQTHHNKRENEEGESKKSKAKRRKRARQQKNNA